MRRYVETMASRGVVVALTAVFGVLSSRLLGPSDKGLYSVLTLIPAIASTLGMCAGPQYIIARYSRNADRLDAASRLLRVASTITLALGVVGALVIGGRVLGHTTSTTLTILVLTGSAATGLVIFEFWAATLQVRSRFTTLAWARIAQCLLPGIGMVVGFFTIPTYGAVLGFSLGTWASAAPACRAWSKESSDRARTRVGSSSCRLPWNYLLITNLSLVVLFLAYRADVFVLAALSDSRQVGLYTAAVAVAECTLLISLAYTVVRTPAYARGQVATSGRDIAVLVGLTTAVGVTIAFTTPWLVPLVFGEAYRDSIEVVWILLPGMVFLATFRFLSSIEMARFRRRAVLLAALSSVVVDGTVLLVLAPSLGARAAATGASSSYAVALLVLLVCRGRRTSDRGSRASSALSDDSVRTRPFDHHPEGAGTDGQVA